MTASKPLSDHRRNLIVWAGMLYAIAMYFVVMLLVHPAEPADNPGLVNALIAVALVLVAASFFVKSRFFAQARESSKPGLRQVGQLLALAFCEAAALLGLVAWFITAWPRSYLLVVAGFVGTLLHHPTREE
jgi:hypothetical protein